MSREWKPGEPIPKAYCGMPVTFAWNDVALTLLLRALENEYTSGYISMCEHVREAMKNYTPPKPDEPTGLGAVVLGSDGNLWVAGPGVPGGKRWEPEDGGESRYYRDVPAISEMSVGVEPMADWERDLLREVER